MTEVNMALTIGAIITRKELTEYVGAGGDSCFLHKNGNVVAIAMDPKKNPNAPGILLVGRGPQKERFAVVIRQADIHVPTFVKEGVDRWKYVGKYKAFKIDNSPSEITPHAINSGRTDIWGVLSLESEVDGEQC
jgi:hypothetical protein